MSRILIEPLESAAPPIALNDVPESPVIVVLGGTVLPQWGETYLTEELAGSRLLAAARLYKLGKARKILATSGISYKTATGDKRAEAEDMRDILVSMGVSESDIIIEPNAKNTHENAIYSAKIMRELGLPAEIILVSSAYHMHRAIRWFEAAGFTIHPYGAGRSVKPVAYRIADFIPSPATLTRSTSALREYLGMIPVFAENLWQRL